MRDGRAAPYMSLCVVWVMCFGVVHSSDAELLTIAVGHAKPPYVVQTNDGGIELEILRAALNVVGHDFAPRYMPNEESFSRFEAGEFDGVHVHGHVVSSGYRTEVVVTFHNFALSLRDRHFEIERLSDLKPRRVLAFSAAKSLLGPDFRKVALESSGYSETGDQLAQVKALFVDGVEVLVIDRSIFAFYRKRLLGDSILSLDLLRRQVVYHNLLPTSDYAFVFKSKEIRDDFNRGLKAIRADGTYDSILEAYESLSSIYSP